MASCNGPIDCFDDKLVVKVLYVGRSIWLRLWELQEVSMDQHQFRYLEQVGGGLSQKRARNWWMPEYLQSRSLADQWFSNEMEILAKEIGELMLHRLSAAV